MKRAQRLCRAGALVVAIASAAGARAQEHGHHPPEETPAHTESGEPDEHARMMRAMMGPLGIPLAQNAFEKSTAGGPPWATRRAWTTSPRGS